MQVIHSSKVLVDFQWTTMCYILEDGILQITLDFALQQHFFKIH
jgi:hypothetical protein